MKRLSEKKKQEILDFVSNNPSNLSKGDKFNK